MKLTPAHRVEIERLINAFHAAGVQRYAAEDRISPRLDQIFGLYGLDSSSALDCTDRVLGASDEFTLDDIVAIDQRSPTQLLMSMRHERLPDGRTQLHIDGERLLEKFAPRARWSAHDAAEMPRLMSAFFESPYGLLNVHESLLRAEIDLDAHPSLTHAMTAQLMSSATPNQLQSRRGY
ncbi:hypothetical protein [Microbacterium aerolatum]|uniref:hypothetical protein n=1 Tax=Microbacterium aerolatum TaxID=153731 RepID=UPI00384FB531